MLNAASVQDGLASYYSDEFQGRKTSNGEIFDNAKLTGAHRTFPFGTVVKVTNLATEQAVEVRINDRGPVKPERVIDLTRAAAQRIGIERAGLGRVRVEVLEWGNPRR
jgi:rare lipoprotein A